MAMTRVLVKTLLGDMTLELDGDKAPATVANFVAYAESGHYDGTIFHRVINNFMIQGGGFDADMGQKTSKIRSKTRPTTGLKMTVARSPWRERWTHTRPPHSFLSMFLTTTS